MKDLGFSLTIGLVLVAGCLTTGDRSVYDVRDFGAVGDGVTKDTAAIQAAIDAASSAGGGTVELPSGTYVSGSIWLKSNVDFHPRRRGAEGERRHRRLLRGGLLSAELRLARER